MATNPRIKLPDNAKAGEVIEVKTLITHVMETGNRKDKYGKQIPRDIINTFVAKFGEQGSVPRRVGTWDFRQSVHLVSDARAGAGRFRIRLDR